MAAGDHGEIKVVVCNSLTGECWVKNSTGNSFDSWRYLGSPDIKPKEPNKDEIKPKDTP